MQPTPSRMNTTNNPSITTPSKTKIRKVCKPNRQIPPRSFTSKPIADLNCSESLYLFACYTYINNLTRRCWYKPTQTHISSTTQRFTKCTKGVYNKKRMTSNPPMDTQYSKHHNPLPTTHTPHLKHKRNRKHNIQLLFFIFIQFLKLTSWRTFTKSTLTNTKHETQASQEQATSPAQGTPRSIKRWDLHFRHSRQRLSR